MSLANDLAARLVAPAAVLGVGNSARGDDGAGSAVARALVAAGAAGAIDGGDTPESYIPDVAQLRPRSVLVLDAVDLGAQPGAVALVEGHLAARAAFDTHRVPLDLVLRVLGARTGARCHVLGIQPERADHGAGLSPAVAATVETLVCLLLGLLPAAGSCRP